MSILSDDLAAIYADTSVTVPVIYGAGSSQQSTRGHFSTEDIPENDESGGVVIASRRVVTIQQGAITGLTNDTAITVDCTDYTIHGVRAAGRGRTKIILAG